MIPARAIEEALHLGAMDRMVLGTFVLACRFLATAFVDAAIDAGMVVHVGGAMAMTLAFVLLAFGATLYAVPALPNAVRVPLHALDYTRPGVGRSLFIVGAVLGFNFLAMAVLAAMTPRSGVLRDDAARDFLRPGTAHWSPTEDRTLMKQQVGLMSTLAAVTTAICISAVL